MSGALSLRWIGAVALAALMLTVAPAGAAPPGAEGRAAGVLIGFVDGTRVLREHEIRFRASGGVTVRFHGDPATGCADHGLCEIADGETRWRSGPAGRLIAIEYVRRGRRGILAVLDFDPGRNLTRPDTRARVTRTLADGSTRTCSDREGPAFLSLTDLESIRARGVRVSAVGGVTGSSSETDAFASRCAGPREADLTGALPSRVLGLRTLRRGRTAVDLSGEAPFASRGLAGTLSSTVKLRLGRTRTSSRQPNPSGALPEGIETHRERYVFVTYAVERVGGSVAVDLRGLASQPVCSPYDACGLAGAVTLTPSATRGTAWISANAPARRPRRDLLAALGLSSRGRTRGVQAGGTVTWGPSPGGIAATVRPEGAPAACRDTATLPAGYAFVEMRSGRARAAFGQPEQLDPRLLVTRCPGPLAAGVSPSGPLASGSVPLTAFRKRRVTLRLTRGASFRTAGYRGSTRPDMTIVLKRRRVREQVVEEP